MKNILLTLFLLTFLASCNQQKLTPKETITKFYNAFNTSNYNEIKKLISDSVTVIQGKYIMPYNHNQYYELFKWDSVFKPTYNIVNLEEEKDQIHATISSCSKRYKFLCLSQKTPTVHSIDG